MCGIAGFFHTRDNYPGSPHKIARAMGEALDHRGPDGNGIWVDEGAQAAFSHRRLAIVDLSNAGHQPMTSKSGRMVICYNGEIYNSKEISAELTTLGVKFRGHSDTEVILEGCAHWGV